MTVDHNYNKKILSTLVFARSHGMPYRGLQIALVMIRARQQGSPSEKRDSMMDMLYDRYLPI